MLTLVVTTSRRADAKLTAQAEQIAERLGAPFVPRRGQNLTRLMQAHNVDGVVVVRPDGAVFTSPKLSDDFFFHPNMAKVRIKGLQLGRPDPMIAAMNLHEGDTVLDCTLGRGSDAIVASFVVGRSGRVVGIEVVPLIATLVAVGLKEYVTDSNALNEAMRRVEVVCADHREALAQYPSASFDVVYFDPLFSSPVMQSQAMASLRELADPRSISPEVLAEAVRVARRRVVIKDSRGSPLWKGLGISQVEGGRGSRIEYGIVRVDETR